MFEFSAISGFAGALAFGLISALLIAADRGSVIGRLLIFACLSSTTWLALGGAYYAGYEFGLQVAWLSYLELIRDVAWIALVGALLLQVGDKSYSQKIRSFLGLGILVAAATATLLALTQFPGTFSLDIVLTRKVVIASQLSFAILGLVFVEQLMRLTRADKRWAIKHLCIALGGIFAYDFYLYADGLLFTNIDPNVWSARGVANACAVPLIAIAAARNRSWDLNIFVSRRVVFHSTAALAAGLYLLMTSLAGYYLNSYGGTWGGALRAAFVFAALLFLVALVLSSQLRSRLRLFLAKHFYKNRYEYGEVWLSFTQTLSLSDSNPDQLRHTMLRAIADIVDSTGGIMWSKTEDGSFAICANYLIDGDPSWKVSGDHSFIHALATGGEVIELGGSAYPPSNERAVLPWLSEMRRPWIAVPILHDDELLGFLVLAEARTSATVTWEDRDLLRTVGRQAASYLAFLRATEALAEASQFEAFNRLSAFLVHDLKNVVAQLSLVVRNAERHRNNPEFIEDAFTTVGDAVTKVNRMLASLRQETNFEQPSECMDLNVIIEEAVQICSDALPRPTFVGSAAPIFANMVRDRFVAALEHLIQNAQDASSAEGIVKVVLSQEGEDAIVSIIDQGCGMDAEFIRTRLFRPFDTTKGKAGMGIGVYESRHIVSAIGGRLDVLSTVGEGTVIKISLPCVESKPGASEFAGVLGSEA